MFARVSTYRAADADRLSEGFRSVTGPLDRMDGFSHAYFLVDRQRQGNVDHRVGRRTGVVGQRGRGR
jgi:hypothetical protein